ncbi:type III restriction protein res subunit [groundwater metagenome]
MKGFFTIIGSSIGNVFQLQELYGINYDRDDKNNKKTEMTKMTGNPFYAGGNMFPFKYYFAQREAVETIIYLHEITKVKDKYDMLRFDSSDYVKASMFDENWKRFVTKMATGTGKTKVLSLILAWSFFHKLYEENSTLARNFLVITPNIIVLDRIRADFDG